MLETKNRDDGVKTDEQKACEVDKIVNKLFILYLIHLSRLS